MKSRYAFVVILAAVLATPAFAQKCEPTDTISTCIDKFVVQGEAATEAETADTAAAATTGLTNVVSPAESSLKDFLSLLAASLESATSSEKGQAYTFDWNPPFAPAQSIGLKFQASFVETKLNDQVTKQLGDKADQIKELTDSLEFGDDATLSGFVGAKTFTHGRSIQSQKEWFRPMMKVKLAERQPQAAALQEIIDDPELELGQMTQLGNDKQGNKLDDKAKVDRRIAAVEAKGQEMKASRAAREPFFKAFAKLLNNQPQYYGAVIYHGRRNVIGPNEWSGKFTYEFAGNNLNAFRTANPDCATANQVKATTTAAAECASKLTAFANATHAGIERVSVSLEYHKANRRWIADPDAGLDLGFPRTRSFIGSVVFGTTMTPMMPLRATTTGVGDARLDFTAKYELPEDDKSEEKGFVGTLTYTQKISETFSLPLSFVYSDHESDLINVQKRFSARFGLMYKLPDFK